jgi:hypothetical protein
MVRGVVQRRFGGPSELSDCGATKTLSSSMKLAPINLTYSTRPRSPVSHLFLCSILINY